MIAVVQRAALFALLTVPVLFGQADLPRVTIRTALGDIEVELEARRAPVTSANFVKYVDAGLYSGGYFHRTVRRDNQPDDRIKIEVIQAGMDPARAAQAFAPIPLERTTVTGLAHRNGTISMARGAPDTAQHEFFICIGDQPALDFGGKRNPDGQGFAAFGRVVRGMEVVLRIHQSPADKQTLAPPIRILRAERAR
jgi:peptidyl-prolyl cis-trans isomerase A (cyclophilin A)